MADVKKHVQGLDKIAYALAQLGPQIRSKHLSYAVMKGTEEVRDAARKLAPKDTGRLESAIIMKFIPDRSNNQQVMYYVLARRGKKFKRVLKRVKKGQQGPPQQVSQDAYYWRFVEFGTANQKAQPFMRPAFEQQKEKAARAIIDLLRKGVDQVAEGLR